MAAIIGRRLRSMPFRQNNETTLTCLSARNELRARGITDLYPLLGRQNLLSSRLMQAPKGLSCEQHLQSRTGRTGNQIPGSFSAP